MDPIGATSTSASSFMGAKIYDPTGNLAIDLTNGNVNVTLPSVFTAQAKFDDGSGYHLNIFGNGSGRYRVVSDFDPYSSNELGGLDIDPTSNGGTTTLSCPSDFNCGFNAITGIDPYDYSSRKVGLNAGPAGTQMVADGAGNVFWNNVSQMVISGGGNSGATTPRFYMNDGYGSLYIGGDGVGNFSINALGFGIVINSSQLTTTSGNTLDDGSGGATFNNTVNFTASVIFGAGLDASSSPGQLHWQIGTGDVYFGGFGYGVSATNVGFSIANHCVMGINGAVPRVGFGGGYRFISTTPLALIELVPDGTDLGVPALSVGGVSSISAGINVFQVTDSSYNVFMAVDNAGATIVNSSVKINSPITTVNGSTSGSIKCSMPFQGANFKKVMIRNQAMVGTATYTFPTAFLFSPYGVTTTQSSSLTVTSINVNYVQVTGSGGAGMITIEGY